ncbi:MAG TPA: RluA family pseudouridine synthase [Acidimicrobiales bacterium]|nr:RluA family pseudouridine synthase [Acidimicrobiales bacterium]
MREVVPRALDGQRLDRVVALVTGGSRAEAAALVDEGAVTVGGSPVTTRSHRVAEGDLVDIDLPDRPAEIELAADPSVPVPVVHEDADVIVVDKPAGVVVHPGAGQGSGTLVNGLLARYPEIRDVGQPDRPGIVHRLDKGTSGLLVVARSAPAYDRLVAMLGRHEIDRRYRTLVWGTVASPSGLVDAPVGRSGRERTRMAVTVRGKPARTWYDVVRTFHQPVEVTELVCRLETGRTHQIRVHMASIGHRVVGDGRYGGDRQSLPLARPFLHAEHLGFDHPITGEALTFTSPLPDDLAQVLARLS